MLILRGLFGSHVVCGLTQVIAMQGVTGAGARKLVSMDRFE